LICSLRDSSSNALRYRAICVDVRRRNLLAALCQNCVRCTPKPWVNTINCGDTPTRIDVVEVLGRKVRWRDLLCVSTGGQSRFPSGTRSASSTLPIETIRPPAQLMLAVDGYAAVQRTGACRWTHSPARSAWPSRHQLASGQRSVRRHMRAKWSTPITCPDRRRRKEPLRSDQRFGRVERRRFAPIPRAGRDNFGDNLRQSSVPVT
jgi:hypothetical protein